MQKRTFALLISSLALLSGCKWWSRQSAWQASVEQTMASKKDGQITAHDKFGTPIIFEWEKVDPQSPQFSEKTKNLPKIYGFAFAPSVTQFLSTYPEVVLSIDDFKPFEPLFKKKGIENVDWIFVEEMIRIKMTDSFHADIMPPQNTISWLIIAKDTATQSPLGFLQFSISSDDLPGNIHIKNLAFKPEAQHCGLGKLIMSSLFKLLPNTLRIYLRALKTNVIALNAYYSYGFREYISQNTDEYGSHKLNLEYKTDESNILQKTAESFWSLMK